jgi:hypothetical protein
VTLIRTLAALTLLTLLLAAAAGCGADAGENAARSGCHPSYEGACLDPSSYDYDCEGGDGNGPNYTGEVRVVGDDPFDLDRDGDGSACEPYYGW